jgi:hypothetical protein
LFLLFFIKVNIMSINELSVKEINEVSGAAHVPDWVSEAVEWGGAGAILFSAAGPEAAPLGAFVGAGASIAWDIAPWLARPNDNLS